MIVCTNPIEPQIIGRAAKRRIAGFVIIVERPNRTAAEIIIERVVPYRPTKEYL